MDGYGLFPIATCIISTAFTFSYVRQYQVLNLPSHLAGGRGCVQLTVHPEWSSRTHAQDFSHTYAMSKCFRHIKGVDFHDIQATTYTLNGTLSCDQPTELLIFHFPALPPLPPPPYTGPSNEPVLTIRNPSTPSLQNGPLIPQSSDHAQQQLAPLVTAFTPVEQAETGPHTQSVTYNDLIRHNIRSLIHGPAVSSLHPPSPPREQGQTYVVLLQWTSVEAMQIAREQEERGINEAVRRVKENVPGLEVEEGMCLGFRDWKGEGGRGCAMM